MYRVSRLNRKFGGERAGGGECRADGRRRSTLGGAEQGGSICSRPRVSEACFPRDTWASTRGRSMWLSRAVLFRHSFHMWSAMTCHYDLSSLWISKRSQLQEQRATAQRPALKRNKVAEATALQIRSASNGRSLCGVGCPARYLSSVPCPLSAVPCTVPCFLFPFRCSTPFSRQL
jgi:hypothetical protein